MVKARTAKKIDAAPAFVPLSFPRITIIPMPGIIAHRGSCSARTIAVVKAFNDALAGPGGQITISLPADVWLGLARLCAGCDTGGFGPRLLRELARLQDAPEREKATRAKSENDSALKLAADELRAREAAEQN